MITVSLDIYVENCIVIMKSNNSIVSLLGFIITINFFLLIHLRITWAYLTQSKVIPTRMMSKVTDSAYNCIDTGGFFIACFKSKVLKIMDDDKFGKSDDDSIILKMTKCINGADNGIAQREIATKKGKEVINDGF
jgi:hypothetical protein